jgi:adenosine deaminase CECR1
MRFLLLFLGLALVSSASPFATRFEEIKRTAKPAELYTFLYALPKGGDLHNHLGGAIRSEWWYAAATDPARNGGDVFYTRVKFTAGLDTGRPLILFHNIRQHTYATLPSGRLRAPRLAFARPEAGLARFVAAGAPRRGTEGILRLDLAPHGSAWR